MNSFEKLLMVLVPITGLSMILYFFLLYLPNIDNGSLRDNQRLQGNSHVRTINTQVPNNHSSKPRVIEKVKQKGYVKWSTDKNVTYMPQSLQSQTYKQVRQQPSYTYPVETYNDQSALIAQQKYQQRIQDRKLKQQQKKINEKNCSYYEEMKELSRDRMRRKYKASQYNRLEKRRKYWAKLYADNCFSGYQYPR